MCSFGRNSSEEEQLNDEGQCSEWVSSSERVFSYEVLASATKNFHPDMKLGQGGFGPVYKGKLKNGKEIAVKMLSKGSRQGDPEFKNEASLLARVHHRNVVSLLGYCVHGPEKLLVYEYVRNESLDKLLFDSTRKEMLDWKRRYDIIAGVARGLRYLHEDSQYCIIHRDIKASNILLDEEWVPKIADFGLARLFIEDGTHVSTRVAGTNGYMAPEYLKNRHLSVKADVFSFGVVILELISGQKNSSFNADPQYRSLLEWAYKLHRKDQSLDIMDATLASSAELEQVKMCIHIGLLCTQGDRYLRPPISRVTVLLSRKPGSKLEEPTRPGDLGSRYRRKARDTGGASSSMGTAGKSSDDSSPTFGTTATASTSAHASRISNRRPGKQPLQCHALD